MQYTHCLLFFFPYKLEQHSKTVKCGVVDGLTDSAEEMHFTSIRIYLRTC